MKNTFLKLAFVALLGLPIAFTACKDKTTDPAPVTPVDSAINAGPNKAGVRLATGDWIADSITSCTYTPSTSTLDLEAVRYKDKKATNKVIVDQFVVSMILKAGAAANGVYDVTFSDTSRVQANQSQLIFFGTREAFSSYSISPINYVSKAKVTVSNFNSAATGTNRKVTLAMTDFSFKYNTSVITSKKILVNQAVWKLK